MPRIETTLALQYCLIECNSKNGLVIIQMKSVDRHTGKKIEILLCDVFENTQQNPKTQCHFFSCLSVASSRLSLRRSTVAQDILLGELAC